MRYEFEPREEYTATAGQTLFTYRFKIYDESDIKAYSTDPTADADDDTDEVAISAITGVGSDDGGTVTLPAQTAGHLVTLVQEIPYERTVNYLTSGDFQPETVNNELDRMVSLINQVASERRGFVFEKCQQGFQNSVLDPPVANGWLRWNPTATRVITVMTPPSTGTVTSVTGSGVDNIDADNPVITSVVSLEGDQVDVSDLENPKIVPQIFLCDYTRIINDYTFTPEGSMRSIPDDDADMDGVMFLADIAVADKNAGASTIALSPMTTRDVYKDGVAVSAGDLIGLCLFQYDHANTRYNLLFSSKASVVTSDQADFETIWSDEGVLKLSSHPYDSDQDDGVTIWSDSGTLKRSMLSIQADQADFETVYEDAEGDLKMSTYPNTSAQTDPREVFWDTDNLKISCTAFPTSDPDDGVTIWEDSNTLKCASLADTADQYDGVTVYDEGSGVHKVSLEHIDTSVRTASYTIVDGEHTNLITGASASVDATLSVSPTDGETHAIKCIDATTNTCRVMGTIDGATNYTFTNDNESIIVRYDGTAWQIIASHKAP